MTDETSKRFAHVKFGVRTDVGRKRRNNEDAHGEWPAQGVFCVADGMGGAQDGEVASRAVIESLAGLLPRWAAFDPPVAQEDRLDALARALDAASFWIKSYADSQGKKGCGSTFVGVCLDPADPTKAATLHAGDSRVYRVRGRKIVQITRDHSVAQMAGVKDEKELSPMFRSLILRAVGIKPAVETERTPMDVAKGDRILICSDGLSRMVPDKEIAKIAAEAETPDAAADALVDRANELGGKDNVTVVAIFVGALPAPAGVHARLSDEEMASLFAAPGGGDGDSTTCVTDGSTRSDETSLTIPKGAGAFDSSGEFFPSGGLPPPPALPAGDDEEDEPSPDTDEIPVAARLRRRMRGLAFAIGHALRTPAGAAVSVALAVTAVVAIAVPPAIRAAAERRQAAEEARIAAKRKAADEREKACLDEMSNLRKQCKDLAVKIGEPIEPSSPLVRFGEEERKRFEAERKELGSRIDAWKKNYSPDETKTSDIDADFLRIHRVCALRVAAAEAGAAAQEILEKVRSAEARSALDSVASEADKTKERIEEAIRKPQFSEVSYPPFRNVVVAWSNQWENIQTNIRDRKKEWQKKARDDLDNAKKVFDNWASTISNRIQTVPTYTAALDLVTEMESDFSNDAAEVWKLDETAQSLPDFSKFSGACSNCYFGLKSQLDKRVKELKEDEKKTVAVERKEQATDLYAEKKTDCLDWGATLKEQRTERKSNLEREAFLKGSQKLEKILKDLGDAETANQIEEAWKSHEDEKKICSALESAFRDSIALRRFATAPGVFEAERLIGLTPPANGVSSGPIGFLLLLDAFLNSVSSSDSRRAPEEGVAEDPADKDGLWKVLRDTVIHFGADDNDDDAIFVDDDVRKVLMSNEWEKALLCFSRELPKEENSRTVKQCLLDCLEAWKNSKDKDSQDQEIASAAKRNLERWDADGTSGGGSLDHLALAIAGFKALCEGEKKDMADSLSGKRIREYPWREVQVAFITTPSPENFRKFLSMLRNRLVNSCQKEKEDAR